jgi:GntR family transcriptional regulator
MTMNHSSDTPDVKLLSLMTRFGRDVSSDLPKHAQMRHLMLAAIKAGHFPPGCKLPPELELTAMTPFSLGTVQRALRDLVDAGIILRRQGSGSFVADRDRKLPYPLHCRFLDESGTGYLPIYSTTLTRQKARDAGPWVGHIGGGSGQSVVEISRRIDVNHEFTVHSRFFAVAGDLGSLVTCDIGDLDGANFKLRIAEEMGLPVTRVNQFANVRRVSAEAAPVIGISSNAMVLHVVAVAAAAERPLYVQEFEVPPTERLLVSGLD